MIVLALGFFICPYFVNAQDEDLPVYLRDRGTGVPSSMFATYIQKGELVVYLFYEYYINKDAEYSPEELGFGLDQDFRGRGRAHEGLIFLGYGITDWLIIELEAAVITESLETAAEDPTGVPDKIEESGLGDVEGQIRWRWLTERKWRPEVFSYFETVLPLQPDRVLIGTQDWEFKLGTGITKGSAIGTFTGRAAMEFDTGEKKLELGEYAVEYVKKLSRLFRVYLGVEGSQDEVELITELQIHPTDFLTIKLNNGIGITSKADDWAPEVGLMFWFFK
jgi:hypothetical protein